MTSIATDGNQAHYLCPLHDTAVWREGGHAVYAKHLRAAHSVPTSDSAPQAVFALRKVQRGQKLDSDA